MTSRTPTARNEVGILILFFSISWDRFYVPTMICITISSKETFKTNWASCIDDIDTFAWISARHILFCQCS